MHFHLPKPLHGWREFFGEVGIIVIGVLIALGAEQVVEALHHRSVAADTRAQISDELNSDLMSISLRDRAEPCIERRLYELRKIITEWEQTGSFRTPQWVAQTPVIEIELSRYDAALARGGTTLLSGEEQYRIGAVAARIRRFNQLQLDERRCCQTNTHKSPFRAFRSSIIVAQAMRPRHSARATERRSL